MSLMRLQRMKFRLVKHGNEDRAGCQVAQQFNEDGIATKLGDPDVKIAHEAGQALPVARGYGDFLFLEMRQENAAPFFGKGPHTAH